ncbi:MAG: MATE family efflux transporter [Bacilli bacterium]|nr:MATE family efflux transporter [Bacilli bacterium]
MKKIRKLIGTKAFYISVIAIVIPIMLQQGLTSLVGLLDNIMVGRLDADSIAGVAVSNQILFVFITVTMGGLAGPGIFVSQYFGAKDEEHLRQSFRFKILLSLGITLVAMAIFTFFGETIIRLVFDNDEVSEELAVGYGLQYLNIIIISLPLYSISQVIATTLREIGKVKIPLYSSIAAIVANCILNYILIFGKLGFPALGVAGAAYATLISRAIEAGVLIVTILIKKYSFSAKIFTNFRIDSGLTKSIARKGTPLLLNELFWGMGSTLIMFSYALRGKAVVAALSISSAASNLLFVVFGALGMGIAIFVGKELGANKIDEAKDNANKLLAFAVFVSAILAALYSISSPYIPLLYNVSNDIRHLATSFILVICCCMPIFTFNVGCFFILRSGGKTIYTMIFDSGFQIFLSLPLAFILAKYTNLGIVAVYFIVQGSDIFKTSVGLSFVRSGKWATNLTTSHIVD